MLFSEFIGEIQCVLMEWEVGKFGEKVYRRLQLPSKRKEQNKVDWWMIRYGGVDRSVTKPLQLNVRCSR